MREGECCVSAGERRIQADRVAEEPLGVDVVRTVELVHVPEAPVIRLPGVERARRLQQRALALGRLDLLGDGGHDAIDDRVHHGERVARRGVELVRPDDARAVRLRELDHDGHPAPMTPDLARH
ncbi:MAG TPA: hypothetical protein VHE30_24620, partial [Polyangiaceae bacterium]|nr:hypothetical protein [Polyangiaceae bacterium]